MNYGWDDFVWCADRKRYLWANGEQYRMVRGVKLDANEAVKQLRNIA